MRGSAAKTSFGLHDQHSRLKHGLFRANSGTNAGSASTHDNGVIYLVVRSSSLIRIYHFTSIYWTKGMILGV
jgi:hypothetical protein